jgi:hypothetical protein
MLIDVETRIMTIAVRTETLIRARYTPHSQRAIQESNDHGVRRPRLRRSGRSPPHSSRRTARTYPRSTRSSPSQGEGARHPRARGSRPSRLEIMKHLEGDLKIRPETGQPDPEDPVPSRQTGSSHGSLEDQELMAERQILDGYGRSPEEQDTEERPQPDHDYHWSTPASGTASEARPYRIGGAGGEVSSGG